MSGKAHCRGSEIWDGSRRRVRIFKGRDEGKDLARKGNCVNRSLNVGMQHRNRQVHQVGQVGETSGKENEAPSGLSAIMRRQ